MLSYWNAHGGHFWLAVTHAQLSREDNWHKRRQQRGRNTTFSIQLFLQCSMSPTLHNHWLLLVFFFLYSPCSVLRLVNYVYDFRWIQWFNNLTNRVISCQADGCHLNKFFVSFNLILCVVVSIISILPKVQEGKIHLYYCIYETKLCEAWEVCKCKDASI